jgi:hypothetical protein
MKEERPYERGKIRCFKDGENTYICLIDFIHVLSLAEKKMDHGIMRRFLGELIEWISTFSE